VQTLYFNLLGLGLLSFILTVILTYPLLLLLRKLKSFQTEREEGPESHKKKSGTPTMGGIGFVLVISALSFFVLPSRFFPLIGLFGGFALIGFLDDFLKIIRKQNQGLTFWQKMFLQIMVSSLFSFTIIDPIHLGAVSGFLKLFSLNYFWVYYLFSVFVIVGGANAANLTDGLDGLLAGAAVLAFICFGYVLINQLLLPASSFSFIVGGALLGFLFYNAPAKKRAWLFMGDVGSLPVGAALSGLAIMTHNEILLVVIAANIMVFVFGYVGIPKAIVSLVGPQASPLNVFMMICVMFLVFGMFMERTQKKENAVKELHRTLSYTYKTRKKTRGRR